MTNLLFTNSTVTQCKLIDWKAAITIQQTKNNREYVDRQNRYYRELLRQNRRFANDKASGCLFETKQRGKYQIPQGKDLLEKNAAIALSRHLSENYDFNLALTITLKQGLVEGDIYIPLTREIAEMTARRILANFNKYAFGIAAKRFGFTMNAAFFFERNLYFSSDMKYRNANEHHVGHSTQTMKNGRLHLHAIIELSRRLYTKDNIRMVTKLVRGEEKLEQRYCDARLYKAIKHGNQWVHNDHVIKPIFDDFGWAAYGTKEGIDALIPSATRLS